MAYIKQIWEDRVVEKPMTYTMTTNEDGTVTLTPVPGTITKEGSKVNAERLNHMEEGIYEAAISGGSDVVFIGDTEPDNVQTKLWVPDDEINNVGTEVINSLAGNETNLAPSVNVVNSAIGSIIESGSNSKGVYIKFADGTMICESIAQNTLTGTSSTGYFEISFPSNYISAPNIICTNSYHYASDIIWSVGEMTNTGTTLFWSKISGSMLADQSVDCRYITIGRWKA